MYTSNLRKLLVLIFLLVPAHWGLAQGIKVYSELRREETVQPGESYQGSILLENISDQTQVIKIFPEDYSFDVKQRQAIIQPFQAGRSNRSWITFKPDYIELKPNEQRAVQFMVTVPRSTKDHPLEGTYWSMLIIEPAPLEEAGVSFDLVGERKIKRIIQYAIQIVTHIENTGEKKIEVTESWMQSENDSTNNLYATLRNTGTIAFRSKVKVEIYDQQGRLTSQATGNSAYIYPGCAVIEKLLLPPLPPGSYPALLLIDGGPDALFGMQINLTYKPYK